MRNRRAKVAARDFHCTGMVHRRPWFIAGRTPDLERHTLW